MKTYIPKQGEHTRKWYLCDAEGQVLGRFASAVARRLRGKDNPLFTPHMDMGDFVVVINAEKIRVTGNKAEQKEYLKHSGHPGGFSRIPYARMKAKKPEEIIFHAVRGMLPKNRLGRKLIKKLKVYAGPGHPHAAQRPEPLQIGK